MPDGGSTAGLPEKNAFSGAPSSEASLWDQVADLTPYDVLLLSCEGGETYGANPANLSSYLDLGGRVLASHFHYSWFAGPLASGQAYSPPLDWGSNLAAWTSAGGNATAASAIPQTTLNGGGPFAKGVAAETWLTDVGALTASELPIQTPRYNATVSAANTRSQPWLKADNASTNPGAAMLFTFDTPASPSSSSDGGPGPYCGRVAYTDLHDDGASDTVNTDGGAAPPTGCSSSALTPQEKELEFLFFDLNGCVLPDTAP